MTSENKCVWAPKPCIMRSFGLKMQQKQVWEIFRKVCQTCFLRDNCRLSQRLLNNANADLLRYFSALSSFVPQKSEPHPKFSKSTAILSERAKGAAKASCGETVVQKGVFGESVSSLPPLRFALKAHENLKGAERKRTLQKHPFGRPFLRTTPSPLLGAPPF